MARAVLFDLDGTLVDSAPAIAAALSLVRAQRGLSPLCAQQVRPWISLGAPELVRLALGPGAHDPEADLATMRSVLSTLSTPPDGVYPGVAPLLADLRRREVKLAVVTNKPEVLARKILSEVALSIHFEVVVGGDTTPHAKPHAAPLRCALATLGVVAKDAAFVGDSGVDAQAAAGLNLPFHLFLGGYGAAECGRLPVASRFASYMALAVTMRAPGGDAA